MEATAGGVTGINSAVSGRIRKELIDHALAVAHARAAEDGFSERPEVLDFFNQVASMLTGFDQLDRAHVLYELVVRARLRNHGRQHPASLGALMNLATVLERKGLLHEARKYYELVVRPSVS